MESIIINACIFFVGFITGVVINNILLSAYKEKHKRCEVVDLTPKFIKDKEQI